jgi:prepilin-type N-terminal cleavage/methylation domain-containing protein
MNRNRLHREEGFSLVEVLVALAILAVGLLALALFQVTAINGNAIASRWTTATQLSQARLDQFRHAAWGDITSSPAGGYNTATMQPQYANLPGAAGDPSPLPAVQGTPFYRVWYVNNNSSTLKTITVWTCWKDQLSRWHNVMLVAQRVNVGGM